jgi:G3E family GTPase
VVTAVDVTHASGQLSRHIEAVKQVTMADRLLLTKCDLATPEKIAVVAKRLARANPGAPQIEVRMGEVDAAQVMGCGLYDPSTKTADVSRWLAEEKVRDVAVSGDTHQHDPNRHDALVHAFVLRFSEPFVWPEFTEAIDVLLATCGDRILRVKGLIHIAGENAPRVVQCVQHMRYPESALPAWPDDDHDSRLVFIVRALAQDIVEKAFAMFCSAQTVGAAE